MNIIIVVYQLYVQINNKLGEPSLMHVIDNRIILYSLYLTYNYFNINSRYDYLCYLLFHLCNLWILLIIFYQRVMRYPWIVWWRSMQLCNKWNVHVSTIYIYNYTINCFTVNVESFWNKERSIHAQHSKLMSSRTNPVLWLLRLKWIQLLPNYLC